MCDGCDDNVARKIVFDSGPNATTRVPCALGQSPILIASDLITTLLAAHLVWRHAVTLARGDARGQSMIRLFRCRFLAPPPHVSSGSRATATKGDPLRGAINADAFRALRLRAGLAAVPTTAITRAAHRERLSATTALPEVALHLVGAAGSLRHFLDGARRNGDAHVVGDARVPCAVRADTEVSEL
jgi:hypothetical protein